MYDAGIEFNDLECIEPSEMLKLYTYIFNEANDEKKFHKSTFM